jgi:hypothetical protein
MSELEFGKVFAILATQLRWTDADEMAVRSYYEALRGESLEAIKAAAQKFAQEAGRRFFPTTAEWAEASRHVTTESLRKALPPAREEPWSHECRDCEDTGFRHYKCNGTFCGRKFKHVPHDYVEVCSCRPTNATWRRHNQFGAGA